VLRGKPVEVQQILDEDLEAELFEGKARIAWEWICKQYAMLGSVPREDVFRLKFDYALVDCNSETSHYIHMLRNKYIRNTLVTHLQAAHGTLGTDDLTATIHQLSKAISKVSVFGRRSQDISWKETFSDRRRGYEEVKAKKGLIGYRTPFTSLDELILGWQDGDFVIIAAESGVGKTWFLSLSAHMCSGKQGLKSLFCSHEMPGKVIGRRLDAVEFRLPYEKLRVGKLEKEHENRWDNKIRSNGIKGDIIIVEDDFNTVNNIVTKIDKYKPDIVFVDGLWLIQGDDTMAKWAQMLEMCRFLKLVAKSRNIPILVTAQLTDEGKLASSRQMKRDADIYIEIEIDKDLRLNKQAKIKLKKNREGRVGSTIVYWDVGGVTFQSVTESKETVQPDNIITMW
jgi:replicative DNA helicase